MTSLHGTAGDFSRVWQWADDAGQMSARIPPGAPTAPTTAAGWLHYWVLFCTCSGEGCSARLSGYREETFDPDREQAYCAACDEAQRQDYLAQQRTIARWQATPATAPPPTPAPQLVCPPSCRPGCPFPADVVDALRQYRADHAGSNPRLRSHLYAAGAFGMQKPPFYRRLTAHGVTAVDFAAFCRGVPAT